MDCVEQADRLFGLVRLQLADQVQHDVGSFGAQCRPFALGLLHAILAEVPLAGGDQRADRVGLVGLRHRDQADIARAPLRALRRVGNRRLHLCQPVRRVAHHMFLSLRLFAARL